MTRRLDEISACLGTTEARIRLLERAHERLEADRAAATDEGDVAAIDDALSRLREALRVLAIEALDLEVQLYDHPDADHGVSPTRQR